MEPATVLDPQPHTLSVAAAAAASEAPAINVLCGAHQLSWGWTNSKVQFDDNRGRRWDHLVIS